MGNETKWEVISNLKALLGRCEHEKTDKARLDLAEYIFNLIDGVVVDHVIKMHENI